MDVFAQVVEKIIKEQELIIGPIAFEQAKKVSGLNFNAGQNQVILDGNKKEILEKLISQYEQLFGQASVEVCKDAARNFISQMPKDQIPSQLQ